MAAPLSCLSRYLAPRPTLISQVRYGHKYKTKRPRPKPMPRRVFEEITKPILPKANTSYLPESCMDPNHRRNIVEEPNPYEEFIFRQLKKEIEESKMIIICQPLSISTYRMNLARVALKKEGMKLSPSSSKHMRQLTEGTQLANLEPLFSIQIVRITCPDIKIKELMKVTKKFPELLILGGFIHDRLVSRNMLQELNKLPDIEQLRGELVSILNMARGSRTLTLLNSQQQKLSSNLDQYRKQSESPEAS